MNQNILAGKWKQLRGEVKRRWGKLTDDDFDRVEGSYEKLVGAVQERYGKTAQEAGTEVKQFFDKVA